MIREYEVSYEQRLEEERQKLERGEDKDYSVPHLYNLNEDPLLSGKIYHNLSHINQFLVGRLSPQTSPHIQLQGIGIKEKHAIFEREAERFFLSPGDPGSEQNLFLNGKAVERKEELCDWD